MAAPQGIVPAVRPAASVLIPAPGAQAAQIHGGPANPAHGSYTWEGGSQWMPWEVIPGGHAVGDPQAAWALVGDVPPNAPAGQAQDAYADPIATHSHAAPWPHERIANAGSVSDIQAAADQARANAALHASDPGVAWEFTTQPVPEVRSWDRMSYVTAGEGGMEAPGRQLTGNAGTGRDRTAGFVVPGENLNEHGMDSAHVSRYRRTGDIPVPPNTTQGAQRPLQIQPASSRNYPVGQGSPFEGQIPGYGSDYSAGYTGLASDYQPSPDPPTGPPLQSSQPAGEPVWGYDLG